MVPSIGIIAFFDDPRSGSFASAFLVCVELSDAHYELLALWVDSLCPKGNYGIIAKRLRYRGILGPCRLAEETEADDLQTLYLRIL